MTIDIEPPIVGVGDHIEKKESVNLAALSAVYQLQGLNLVCSQSYSFTLYL